MTGTRRTLEEQIGEFSRSSDRKVGTGYGNQVQKVGRPTEILSVLQSLCEETHSAGLFTVGNCIPQTLKGIAGKAVCPY
jgi:hypothetical protein